MPPICDHRSDSGICIKHVNFCNSQMLLFSGMLASVCYTGDKIVFSVTASDVLWRAAADSAIHGLIGFLSWAVVVSPGLNCDTWLSWLSCVLCGLLACSVDIDHFIASRSVKLKDALNLKNRPFFHSTTLLLIITVIMWLMASFLKSVKLKKITLIYATSWLTHHLRDAVRRGLWLPPLGSSPPVPEVFHVGGTVVFTLCMHLFYSFYFRKPVTDNLLAMNGDSV